MYISASVVSDAITHITGLMSDLCDFIRTAKAIEAGWLPNDMLSYEDTVVMVVNTTDRIQETVARISQMFSSSELEPRFRDVVDAAKGIGRVITELDLDAIRWPRSTLSKCETELTTALLEMNSALAKYIAGTMPLSSLPACAITPELVAKNPQAAIQHTFAIFEDHLRERIGAGPELYGVPLINQAFGDRGSLTYGAVRAEAIGVRNLMAGAYATFRNPSMHRVVRNDETMVLSIISLVDLLARLVDEAEDSSSISLQRAI